MKLAYSTLGCPGWTVEQAAEAARRYGFEGIEWRLADGEVLTPKTPEEVKQRVIQATRTQGLKVACLDTSCKFVQPTAEARAAVVQEARLMVDLAAELEAPYLRVFGGEVPAGLSRAELIEPTAEALKEAADYAGTKGVSILLETHDAWARSSDALSLVKAAASPYLSILWDLHHPYRMGETPRQTFDTLEQGRAFAHVHVKDARRDPERPDGWQLCLTGEGEVPLKEIFELLQQNDYKGFLSLEWEKKWHPEIEEPEEALPQFVSALQSLT
jgi:sugar phosphate isomerase/epimerase